MDLEIIQPTRNQYLGLIFQTFPFTVGSAEFATSYLSVPVTLLLFNTRGKGTWYDTNIDFQTPQWSSRHIKESRSRVKWLLIFTNTFAVIGNVKMTSSRLINKLYIDRDAESEAREACKIVCIYYPRNELVSPEEVPWAWFPRQCSCKEIYLQQLVAMQAN